MPNIDPESFFAVDTSRDIVGYGRDEAVIGFIGIDGAFLPDIGPESFFAVDVPRVVGYEAMSDPKIAVVFPAGH